MADDHEQSYLEARVDGAKELAEIYNFYTKAPDCFIAGVQYALDKMLSRTSDLHDLINISDVLHANAFDILTNAKERQL